MDSLFVCETKVLFFQLASSDEAALNTLMIRCSPKLKKYICNLVNDADSASDVLRELWLKVWEQRSKLFKKRAPLIWIKKCARNHALNMRNKVSKIKATASPLDVELYATECPEKVFNKRNLEQAIRAGLKIKPFQNKLKRLYKMVVLKAGCKLTIC